MPRIYLAIDLGAESGRVVAGVWNGKTIRLEEIHRFPNGPVYLGDSLRWDVVRLWAEIQNGLALAAKKYGKSIVSVGADTWGVDYVLLTGCDEMLGQPYAYRDARTNGMMEKAFKKVPRAEIFSQTGLQFMQFNTLFQLLAHKRSCPGLLEAADAEHVCQKPEFLLRGQARINRRFGKIDRIGSGFVGLGWQYHRQRSVARRVRVNHPWVTSEDFFVGGTGFDGGIAGLDPTRHHFANP